MDVTHKQILFEYYVLILKALNIYWNFHTNHTWGKSQKYFEYGWIVF